MPAANPKIQEPGFDPNPSGSVRPAAHASTATALGPLPHAHPSLPLPLPKVIYRAAQPPGKFPPNQPAHSGRPAQVRRGFREHARGRHNG